LLQIVQSAITVAVGIQFVLYVHKGEHLRQVTIQGPPGVEGFLPIGALMGWQLFF
jgi:hypothetical protein